MWPILAIFLIFWLLIIRPAKRRQQETDRMQSSVGVGTEVATSGGLFGTVVEERGDDRLGIEIAPGVVVTVARRAVAGVVQQAPADADSGSTEAAPDTTDEPGDDHRA
jgi:preprotein translocase subunit YajC